MRDASARKRTLCRPAGSNHRAGEKNGHRACRGIDKIQPRWIIFDPVPKRNILLYTFVYHRDLRAQYADQPESEKLSPTPCHVPPAFLSSVRRGFPKIGDEAFPGAQNFNNQLKRLMDEGGKVYACRFALQALYGHGEPSLIEGIRPINPLDVLDLVLIHKKANAVILDTWTL